MVAQVRSPQQVMFPCLDLRIQFTLPNLCGVFLFIFLKSLLLLPSRCLIVLLRVVGNLARHRSAHEKEKQKQGGEEKKVKRRKTQEKNTKYQGLLEMNLDALLARQTHLIGLLQKKKRVVDGKKTEGGSGGVVQAAKKKKGKRKREDPPS